MLKSKILKIFYHFIFIRTNTHFQIQRCIMFIQLFLEYIYFSYCVIEFQIDMSRVEDRTCDVQMNNIYVSLLPDLMERKFMVINDLTRQLPHFGIICLVKPKMNSPLTFLRKMLKLIFFRIAYYDFM